MDQRKTLTLCLALLLVVGFSSHTAAAEGDPGGWGVTVVSPDSAAWAAIGDSIIITASRTTTIGDSALAVFVALYTKNDTVSAGEMVTTQTGNTTAALATANGTGSISVLFDGRISAALTTPTSTASGVQTYRFAFGVDAGDAESASATALVAQAFIDHGTAGLSEWKQITSINGASQFDVPGSALDVTAGNLATFGSDGQRPLNTQIVSHTMDLPGFVPSGAIGATDTVRAAGLGDVITANIEVTGVGSSISRAEVLLLRPADALAPDSAFAKYSFDLIDLVAGPASKGLTLAASKSAGQAVTAAQNRAFGNGERIQSVAYLVDRAGNLSSAAAGDASPIGFSDITIVHLIDTTVPVITLIHPDSTGDYVTGNIDTTFNLNHGASATAATAIRFTGNAIDFSVSENTVSRTVTDADDDVHTYSAADNIIGDPAAQATTGTYDAAAGEQSGVTLALAFAATDSAGNTSSTTVTGVLYDEVAPAITVFPSNAALNQTSGPDTINAGTAQSPVISYNELPDSVSIRYYELSGADPPDVAAQAVPANKLDTPDTDVEVTVQTALQDESTYSLQVLIIDMAGNASATAPDTLIYIEAFNNPTPNSFLVEPQGPTAADSQLVGTALGIKVTARDTVQDRNAVTYNTSGVVLTVTLAEGDADKLSQVEFTTGDTTGLTGTGMVALDADDWTLGIQTINVYSELVLDSFSVSVADTVGDFEGETTGLFFDAIRMSAYSVEISEDGVSTTGVSGEFEITVTPTDEFGNTSLKTGDALDTQGTALDEIFAEISSNKANVGAPGGPQSIVVGGSEFVGSSNSSGTGLVITALTSSASGELTTIVNDQLKAVGRSAALTFAAEGDAPAAEGAPAAPASLIAQDYLGADGSGDQGGFIMVSFPVSDDHGTVTNYRLWREVLVSTGLDSTGALVTIDPDSVFISWVNIDVVPGDEVGRAVVPTLDNVASNWAITAERGRSSSESTEAASKRVFTKQTVQQMVRLLGVDPNRVYTHDELSQLFTPSADYVKSIIGDQDIQFATLDPDVTAMLGNTAVPTTIRTEGSEVVSSLKTIAAGPVRAVDNIPPAAVTEAGFVSGDVANLSWSESADDRVVAYSSYRGYAIPIAGVDHYEVLGGAAEESLEPIGTSPAGSGEFQLDGALADLAFYRVDALDLDNVTVGPIVANAQPSMGDRVLFTAADESPVFIVTLEGANTPFVEDFEDFLDFAASFDKSEGDDLYNPQADTDDSGLVDFGDFLNFALGFNKTAVTRNGEPIGSSKPVISPQTPGVNESVELSVNLQGDRVLPGQMITLDVDMSNVKALQGYGFTLNYDADKFEFVDAVPAVEDLLKSDGAETPLFLHQAVEGQVMVANTVVNGNPVAGEGTVVSLTFKVLGEFDDQGRFDIADAVVFDGERNSNPVVVLGSLEVQSTPTEFALLQNYPNPFNPETTIKYNLAEGTNVGLRIYNIVGQVVRTLVSERQSAGRYQVRWDGTDDRGSAVSSGIYFYQVSAGKFRDVKRLMLLK